VLVVVFGVPMLSRVGSRRGAGDFRDDEESDSVSKIQTGRTA
jgi:hypothetical protein